MTGKVDIEQLVRSQLAEAELIPSKGTWMRIRRQLLWQKFLQFKPWQLNIYTLGGILMVGASSFLLLNQHQDQEIKPIQDTAYQDFHGAMDVGESHPSDPSALRAVKRKNTDKSEQQASAAGSAQVLESENTTRPISPSEAESVDKNALNTERQQTAGSSASEEDPAVLPPEAYFTPSVTSGCAPLEVTFISRCTHAVALKWLFDDLATSMEQDPVFTFTDPGRYDITVIAVNDAGWARRYMQTIEVHPSPVAKFEFSDPVDTYEGNRESTLLNYSAGASSFLWSRNATEASEKWSSNEFQPLLSSSSVGEDAGSIQLVAINESGCSDTLLKKIPAELLATMPALKFPTAFKPNPSGSIGGNYTPNERRTDIFHPVFVEAPAEYHLRIYTRRGELVFQTDNIYIGWDGYYLQEQSKSDVYVWMAEGKWSNGKEFMLRGDVTLLWNGYQ